jgi:hypothetical protein
MVGDTAESPDAQRRHRIEVHRQGVDPRAVIPSYEGTDLVIVQLHQQAADHLAAALPGLPAGKAPGHLSRQIRQQGRPGIIGYRGSSGCRVSVVSHKPIMIAAAALTRSPT